MSTESGIPDFRSATGIWADVDPFEVASIDAFRRDPAPRLALLRGAHRRAARGRAERRPRRARRARARGPRARRRDAEHRPPAHAGRERGRRRGARLDPRVPVPRVRRQRRPLEAVLAQLESREAPLCAALRRRSSSPASSCSASCCPRTRWTRAELLCARRAPRCSSSARRSQVWPVAGLPARHAASRRCRGDREPRRDPVRRGRRDRRPRAVGDDARRGRTRARCLTPAAPPAAARLRSRSVRLWRGERIDCRCMETPKTNDNDVITRLAGTRRGGDPAPRRASGRRRALKAFNDLRSRVDELVEKDARDRRAREARREAREGGRGAQAGAEACVGAVALTQGRCVAAEARLARSAGLRARHAQPQGARKRPRSATGVVPGCSPSSSMGSGSSLDDRHGRAAQQLEPSGAGGASRGRSSAASISEVALRDVADQEDVEEAVVGLGLRAHHHPAAEEAAVRDHDVDHAARCGARRRR